MGAVVNLWLSFFRDTLPDGGIIFGHEKQDTSSAAAIVSQCEQFMRKNRLTGSAFGHDYSFNQPSTYKYSPSQWLWGEIMAALPWADSCFYSGAHQIFWAAIGSPDLAVADLRSMLSFQLDDGRIPQQINWRYKPGIGNPLKPRLYTKNEYNDLTQMPVFPYSLRSIYKATADIDLLREFVPKLVKHFDWWRNTRRLDDTGLVTILHPWESGLDLSPAYDAALGVDPESRARPAWRQIYPQLIQLCLSYRWRYNWDQAKILSRTSAASGPLNWFKVQDIAVNCVYASGWGILGDLAQMFDPALGTICHGHQIDAELAIIKHLFDPERGRFVTGYKNDRNEQCFHPVETIQSLFPLLLSNLPPPLLQSITSSLSSPDHFGSPCPIASVSRTEAEYNPIQNTDLLWRGTTWGFTNWFVMEGLTLHGEIILRDELMVKWIAMVKKAGIWENYNPETGVGYEAEGLGMSVLIVDWMKRLGKIPR